MSIKWDKALKQTVKAAKAPGAVAYVGTVKKTLYHGATGLRRKTPSAQPAKKGTLYDLASLTKVVATATAVMQLRDAGKLKLDQPVADFLPLPAFRAFTLRHILTHTTGLPAFRAWYKELKSFDDILPRIAAEELSWKPGTQRRYSDLGFVLLTKIVELCARQPLDAYCNEHIFKPLKMNDTLFRPPKKMRDRCAATEQCPWRKRIIQGEVHDETAYALGGVSGHAGLFSTASDLAKFCRGLLEGKVLKASTLTEMTKAGQLPFYPWQGLAWKNDPWRSGAEGFLPSRAAFGHTGWTGTTMWIDPEQGLFSILLSNTCHPSRRQRDSKTLRRTFYTAVAANLYQKKYNVHTGLDRLLWNGFAPLRGKRVGVLTNHAAVDQSGRALLDVLALEKEVQVTRIFSPEHGFKGQAEAGEAVNNEKGAVPVISLYGKHEKPTPEELKGLEVFVADLPDIGARFYTYMATMKACMEACAVEKLPFLVLDRPNPIGGAAVEGNLPQKTDSLVCSAPIPMRHGMTLGELADLFKKILPEGKRLPLQIYEADNWPRDRWFPECSLPWIAPSPNIPTAETALVYAGMCLFEGVNLNEGRGTETPFYRVGAPWLDARAVVRAVNTKDCPGCRLHAITYTPRSIPGKSTHPVYLDEACQGIQLEVTNPRKARPVSVAVALLCALQAKHKEQLEWKEFFDTLTGGPALREAIQSGATAKAILAQFESDGKAFQKKTPQRYGDMVEWLKEDGLLP